MDPLFTCPPSTAITSIPAQDCPENFEQIVKFAFQRVQTTPSFTSTTIKAVGTWTPLLAASDSTKVVITPYLPGVVIPPGEFQKEGGNDNTTINGIPRFGGLKYVPVTTQAESLKLSVRQALQALLSESAITPGFTNIWVYFFNRFNQIIANSDGSGFNAYNIMLGDSGTDGFNKPNKNNFGFDMEGGWSKNATLYNTTAGFKPLAL